MESCIFCQIAGGATSTPFVYEDDEVVAFRDIQPQAPVHLLVVPRRHVASLNEAHDEPLLGRLLAAARTGGRPGRAGAVPPGDQHRAPTPGSRSRTCTCTCWAGASWPGRRAEEGT